MLYNTRSGDRPARGRAERASSSLSVARYRRWSAISLVAAYGPHSLMPHSTSLRPAFRGSRAILALSLEGIFPSLVESIG